MRNLFHWPNGLSANLMGYQLKEVPVVWADDAATKVRLVADALRSLKELFQIRLGAWLGWYPVHGGHGDREAASRVPAGRVD